jgi:hypothetical protein
LKIPPLPKAEVAAALDGRGLPPERAALLAGLSGGALGAALGLDPDLCDEAWRGLDVVLGLKGRPGALAAAIDWTGEFTASLDKLKKRDDAAAQTRLVQELTLDCLRLWHRDVAVLAATGDPSKLLGPPASSAQWAWAKTLTAETSGRFERGLGRLADGLARSLRLDIVFENFWLDVLK